MKRTTMGAAEVETIHPVADLDPETSPQVVADCVAARAAAGAVVEVVRVDSMYIVATNA